MKSAKAGLITPELREALGMGEDAPPPWLINMQRYGPPPSYPDLPVRPCSHLVCFELQSRHCEIAVLFQSACASPPRGYLTQVTCLMSPLATAVAKAVLP